jgi:hypothetical protein
VNASERYLRVSYRFESCPDYFKKYNKVMTYTEALEKSLTVKWKVNMCPQGVKCWCRTISCEEPIMFKEIEESDAHEFYIVHSGELHKEVVEHIVKLHNEAIL